MTRGMELLALVSIGAPMLLLAWLGLCSLVDRASSELITGAAVRVTLGAGFVALLGMAAVMLATGTHRLTWTPGPWLALPEYAFTIKFLFDRLAMPFAVLSYLLCITVGAFALRYMHREPGYNRFFVCYAMFVVGVIVTALAGTIEVLFAGWELVGLSSALLVAFFHHRAGPARNGLRIWSVYRLSDAALLVAAVLLHHWCGTGDWDVLAGNQPWPAGEAALGAGQATIVGLLVLVAAAGKSGLVPFSGWLPRAMEGPTPSSAIFYGALSVHLGAFLLLRTQPIVASSAWLPAAVGILGLVTATHAALTARVQTDIKCALAYASSAQVGIIVVEIGLGLHWVALVHIVGHVCLRSMQLLRAPSLLHDRHQIENALGARLHGTGATTPDRASGAMGAWLYRFSLERGYLDAWIDNYVVTPVWNAFRGCDRLERRWAALLSGRRMRGAKEPTRSTTLDDV